MTPPNVTAVSYGGYTTNLPIEDVTGGKAWVAFAYDGAPLDPEHGGPARLLVPHLYLWKSAKWVRGLLLSDQDQPGFWGGGWLPHARGPMARTALLGRLTWQTVTVTGIVAETPKVRTLALDVPGWPGHRAIQHLDIRLTAEDGYQTHRSYSIASAPGEPVAITIEQLPDGEVSPYLVDDVCEGDQFEVRGLLRAVLGRRDLPPRAVPATARGDPGGLHADPRPSARLGRLCPPHRRRHAPRGRLARRAPSALLRMRPYPVRRDRGQSAGRSGLPAPGHRTERFGG